MHKLNLKHKHSTRGFFFIFRKPLPYTQNAFKKFTSKLFKLLLLLSKFFENNNLSQEYILKIISN